MRFDRFCASALENETEQIAVTCPLRDEDNRNRHVAPNFSLMFIGFCMEYITVIFILITLYIYWIIPDMRQTQVSDNIVMVLLY